MPKFVIERDVPGAGGLSTADLHATSQKSRGVLSAMGPQIQWVESLVTPDKIYCVCIAPNEDSVREHARRGGFPASQVSEVKRMVDPSTAEQPFGTDLAAPPTSRRRAGTGMGRRGEPERVNRLEGPLAYTRAVNAT